MNKRKLKTIGWSCIVVGAYMVYLGSVDDVITTRVKPKGDVIDAEWYEVE